jgi:hypothetical protein
MTRTLQGRRFLPFWFQPLCWLGIHQWKHTIIGSRRTWICTRCLKLRKRGGEVLYADERHNPYWDTEPETQEERVGPGAECPQCHERRADRLEVREDNSVQCSECGTVYEV